MREQDETKPPADAGPVQRTVGRPAPERASVGDVVACTVMHPSPQVLRLTLDSQAATDYFNALPLAERKNWRLEKRVGAPAAASEYTGARCMCVLTGCRAGPGCPHYSEHCKAHIAHVNKPPNAELTGAPR